MVPIKFDLSKYKNSYIYEKFADGITKIEDYNYLLNKFEYNEIEMRNKNFFNIFVDNLINPLYMYQIYAQISWYKESYHSFSIVVFILSFVILLINSYYKYKLYISILSQKHFFNGNVTRNIVYLYFKLDDEKHKRKYSY